MCRGPQAVEVYRRATTQRWTEAPSRRDQQRFECSFRSIIT